MTQMVTAGEITTTMHPGSIRPVDDPSTSDVDESWPGLYDSAATQVDKFPCSDTNGLILMEIGWR